MADFPLDPEETLFGAAFHALPDAACLLEPVDTGGSTGREWRYVASNQAHMAVLDKPSLLGQTLRSAHPHLSTQWYEDLDRVLASGASETLIRRHAVKPLVYEVLMSPVTGAGRQAVMVRLRDVTEDLKTRDKRREADARYKLLFDAIDEGFCIIEVQFDADGTPVDYVFLEANDAFVRVFGHSRSQLVGQPPPPVWADPADQLAFRALLQTEGRVHGMRARGVRQNGSEFEMQVYAEFVAEGSERLVISMVLDVSAEAASRQALEKAAS